MNEHGLAIAMGLSGKSNYFNSAQDNTVTILKQRGGNIWGMNIANIDAVEDVWLQLFDEEPDTMTIEEITDAGSGEINIKITGHGKSTGDLVVISGTINYNNSDQKVPVAITKVDADNFKITATYVEDESTGTAFFPNVVLGTTTPALSIPIFSGDGLQYGILNNLGMAIPIEMENELVFAITKTPTGSDASTTAEVCNIIYK